MKSVFTTFCFLFLTVSLYAQSITEQEYEDYIAQLQVSIDVASKFYQDCGKINQFEEEFKNIRLTLDELDIYISSFDRNTLWIMNNESLGEEHERLSNFKWSFYKSIVHPIEQLKDAQLFYVKLCSKIGDDKILKNEAEVKEIHEVYFGFLEVYKFYSDMDDYTRQYLELLDQGIDNYTCEDFGKLESICNEIDMQVPRFEAYRDSVVASFNALPEAYRKIRIAYNTSNAFEDLPTDSEEELGDKDMQRKLSDFGKEYPLFEEFMGLYAPLDLKEMKSGDAVRSSSTIMAVKEYYPNRMTERLRELITKGKASKACE